ncbi:MAG: 3-hydroxyacyl-CoA dehydrogenase family protein [Alkaliphilus sp.]
MSIKRVLVIGPGQMGAGIAQVIAQSGIEVVLQGYDMDDAKNGLAKITKTLEKGVARGKMSEENKEKALKSITIVGEWNLANCDVDLAIEAVPENKQLKEDIFKKLDELCPEHTILATNTSSLAVVALGALTKRPEKVVGMHFFSPVHIMKLVEVIVSLATNEETLNAVMKLATDIGKTPVKMNDYPGFVGNRIMIPMLNEAIFTLHEGVADKETIDEVAKIGFNHPIGPLRLCDAIGNDTVLAIMEVLYEGFGDSKYRPCPLLRKMVEAGYLGKKSGRGFYNDYRK